MCHFVERPRGGAQMTTVTTMEDAGEEGVEGEEGEGEDEERGLTPTTPR